MLHLRLRRQLVDAERPWIRTFATLGEATAWLRFRVSTEARRLALAAAEPHRLHDLGRMIEDEVVRRVARLVMDGRLVVVERKPRVEAPALEDATAPEQYLGPAPVEEEEEYGGLVAAGEVEPTEEPFFHVEEDVVDEEHAFLTAEADVDDPAFDDDESGDLVIEAALDDQSLADDATGDAGDEGGDLQLEDEVHEDEKEDDDAGDSRLEIDDHVEEHPTPA